MNSTNRISVSLDTEVVENLEEILEHELLIADEYHSTEQRFKELLNAIQTSSLSGEGTTIIEIRESLAEEIAGIFKHEVRVADEKDETEEVMEKVAKVFESCIN